MRQKPLKPFKTSGILALPLPWMTPQEAAARLRSERLVLLESPPGCPVPATSRYSFLAVDPFLTITSRGERTEINGADQPGDPFHILKELLARHQTPRVAGLPPFQGGAAGYFAYDLVRHLERVPLSPCDQKGPEMAIGFYDLCLAWDHAEESLTAIFSPAGRRSGPALREEGEARLFRLWERLQKRPEKSTFRAAPRDLQGNMTREGFLAAVLRCKEYIAAGDVFQVNLSHRLTLPFRGDPFAYYRRLMSINPSPFSSFLEFPDVSIVSASPERLVRLLRQEAETRPIAGTRPRGKSAREEERMRQELLASPKERAEHLMLVDLERNDLGRVARYGTIKVDELMTLERYSHVLHIVSNIRGELPEGLGPVDLLRAVFPGGTVTGVPKIRCMEIIAELEPTSRGIYTGAIGYLSFSGDMDLAIPIRTAVISQGKAHIQAGAGIVADSIPEAEYDETMAKAAALLQALGK